MKDIAAFNLLFDMKKLQEKVTLFLENKDPEKDSLYLYGVVKDFRFLADKYSEMVERLKENYE